MHLKQFGALAIVGCELAEAAQQRFAHAAVDVEVVRERVRHGGGAGEGRLQCADGSVRMQREFLVKRNADARGKLPDQLRAVLAH